MYQALYRKYRPRRFSDVTGQEHVTETLRRQIDLGRLSHAYLFVGTRGTGKTTCAKILSRAVNCQNPEAGEPCNKCSSCVGIENGSILDVLELDAASNNGVDNVRALREEAIYTPASVCKRVYIVDEVHMLSTAAFNALLKILEEPPEHLIFILATTELHKVPATILSRCQRFSFKRVSSAAIAERLCLVAKKEGLTLAPDAAEKLAALADGSMRDGLSLLDQCASHPIIDLSRVLDTIGLAGQYELLGLVGAVADRDTAASLRTLDGLYNYGSDMASLLNDMASLWREVLIYKLSADSPLLSGRYDRAELSGLSKKLNPEQLYYFLDVIREAGLSLSRGGSARLTVEMCLIRMCNERLSDDAAALLARIARLEAQDREKGEARREKENAADAESGKLEVESEKSGDGDAENDSQITISNSHLKTIDVEDGVNSEFRIPNSELSADPESDVPKGGFWHDILELLKDDVPIYMLLSDSANIQAQQQDGTIIIHTGNAFTAEQVKSKMFSAPLKEAAEKVLGREIIIRVEAAGAGGDTPDKREKLEGLSAFGIVQFED